MPLVVDFRMRAPSEPARRRWPAAEERRPHDRGTYRRSGLRVTCPCRREQMRLVAEAEQLVVVREIDIAIERERPQVGEIVEAVALQPRAELQLEREPDREEQARRTGPCVHAASTTPAVGGRRQRHDDRQGDDARPAHRPGLCNSVSRATIERRATSRAHSSRIAAPSCEPRGAGGAAGQRGHRVRGPP